MAAYQEAVPQETKKRRDFNSPCIDANSARLAAQRKILLPAPTTPNHSYIGSNDDTEEERRAHEEALTGDTTRVIMRTRGRCRNEFCCS